MADTIPTPTSPAAPPAPTTPPAAFPLAATSSAMPVTPAATGRTWPSWTGKAIAGATVIAAIGIIAIIAPSAGVYRAGKSAGTAATTSTVPAPVARAPGDALAAIPAAPSAISAPTTPAPAGPRPFNTVLPGPGPGATGSYTAGPYGVVVDNRFSISVNGGAVTTNAAAGAAGTTPPEGTRILGIGGYCVFPNNTQWADCVVPSISTTTNAPSDWVVRPAGADMFRWECAQPIWAQAKVWDGGVTKWYFVTPADSGPLFALPNRAWRFAVADTNGPPVVVHLRFR